MPGESEPLGAVAVRAFRPGDEAAINDGFQAVFGKSRAVAEWAWKFRDGPRGRWIALAQAADGRVCAHFAAIPVAVQLAGEQVLAGQSVDDYCRQRHGLGRRGLYVTTVEWFYRHYGGASGLAFLYGFPGTRHLRLGRALLGYLEPVPVPVLRRPLTGAPAPGLGRHRVDDGVDLAEVERLWRRARRRYPYAVVRDREWLARRYTGRPEVTYAALGARRWGRLRAWGVLRSEGPVLRWVDLIWDGEDARALGALHEAVLTTGRNAGASEAEMWLGGDPQARRALSGLGWQEQPHPEGLGLTAVPLRAGLALAAALPRFYFTLGDSDLA